MKHINIKALFPGCGKSHVLMRLYKDDPHNRKVYLTQNNNQKAEIIEKLKAMGCPKPNVKTAAEFSGTWKYIEIEGEGFYLKTSKPGARAATVKQMDIFIDEVSSMSNTDAQILVNNFNIRNLFTAGDINQFDPIPYKASIYENGTRSRVEYTYNDDGTPFNVPIDTEIILTKSERVDTSLLNILNNIKNCNIQPLKDVIKFLKWNNNKKETDLHIAYTNKVVNSINEEYVAEFGDQQLITLLNDKKFGLMKGRRLTYDEYETFVNLKRLVFLQQQEIDETIDVDAELDAWKTRMFGYAYAVTSHKLQGSTIEDRTTIVHLDDILAWVHGDQDEDFINIEQIERRAEQFHKFLYVACSRATRQTQLRFVYSDINKLEETFKYIEPFTNDFTDEAIYTTSREFSTTDFFNSDNFDPVDYKSFNEDIAKDALNMSFKDWSHKYQLSSGTWKRLRAKYKPVMGSRNVYIRDTLPDPLLKTEVFSSNEDTSTIYNKQTINPNNLALELEERQLNGFYDTFD